MKKTILFIGEHPVGRSGNSNMMRAVLNQLDRSKYSAVCYSVYESVPMIGPESINPLPFNVIQEARPRHEGGYDQLITTIHQLRPSAIAMVGIDIWRYAHIFNKIHQLRRICGFKWTAIFPYDIQDVRKDWVDWIRYFDIPCVYSEYGRDLLKSVLPNIEYFRPEPYGYETFKPLDKAARRSAKEKHFPGVKDKFIFGFVGNNQLRKDPVKALQAFAIVRRERPNTALYLHTGNVAGGFFNLAQTVSDLGLASKGMLHKNQDGSWVSPDLLNEVYNAMDCLVNTSMQEGLSWTLVEAMLSGTPIIATDTTAQTELVKDVGWLVPCQSPAFMYLETKRGPAWIPAKSCKPEDVAEGMIKMVDDAEYKQGCREAGLKKASDWISGIDNINDLLSRLIKSKPVTLTSSRKRAVLFAQHSAAGDVFMTTRCIQGLKKRHPGMPFYYMTQAKYAGLLEGLPEIDAIFDWDQDRLNEFQVVYNPHGEKILPGHWGRNCTSLLSDFYWKLLRIKPGPFRIMGKWPSRTSLQKGSCYVVVHTTGGTPHFRTYKYMADVCQALREKGFLTVQLGGTDDFPAMADFDLRGKLSYRETAAVMEKAYMAVTVDSFVSHLAGAFGINQVCLFGSGNARVVRPNQVSGQLICLTPDYITDCPGLGPCSASIRDCAVPCTGIHDPQNIVKALESIQQHRGESGVRFWNTGCEELV